MTLAREPEDVTSGFLDRLLAEARVACGSLLLVDQNGELVEILRRGMANDPLARRDPGGKSPADVILASRQPFIARVDEVEPAQLIESPWMEEVRNLNLIGVMAVPLVAQDRPLGLVTAYGDTARGPFEDEELELVTAMGANAATALANARAWRSLEQLNRSLEEAVAERTKELQEALQHARKLAEELEDRNLALEAANRQLRDLERLKGDLLNRIAHELNTPVTAIQTAGRILTRYDEVPAEKAGKFVEIITQESHASRGADRLRAPGRGPGGAGGQAGSHDGEPRRVAEARSGAASRGRSTQRKLTVQVKVASGLEQITGDSDQLEAALRAIVKNGVEFNREGGSLAVMVKPVRRGADSMVEMRVEDKGVGIPAADLAHVCDVFWQGGNVMTDKPRGLGLGLAVARRVAENHGGTLEISSEEGKGTVVTMLLPTGGRRK